MNTQLCLTTQECDLILEALRISAEDGSIYSALGADGLAVVNLIESVRKKIGRAR